MRTAAARRGFDVVEGEDDVDRLGGEARRDRVEPDEVEAEEAPRKREIVAQEIEAAKQLLVVGDQRLVFVEADLAEHVGVAARDDDGIAESVEHAEIDAAAMREQLLVQRDRVGFLAEQMEAQRLDPVGRKSQLRPRLRFLVRGLVLEARRRAHGQLQPQARGAVDAERQAERLQRPGAGQIFGLERSRTATA